MVLPAKFIKMYGRTYLLYVAAKWTVLGGSFLLLSNVDGFSLAWMLWWPVVGIPTAITFNVHQHHARKHIL